MRGKKKPEAEKAAKVDHRFRETGERWKKAAAEKQERKEHPKFHGRKYETDDELNEEIERYFASHSGVEMNEFSLAQHLGITSVALRNWKRDGENPSRQYLVQCAYDRMSSSVISDPAWNDKFMQQKSKQILESPIFAGYNTKIDMKDDRTVHVVFGDGSDEDCMK